MSHFNAKNLCLFILLFIALVLLTFFEQLYNKQLPSGFIGVILYTSVVIIVTCLICFFTYKLFSNNDSHESAIQLNADDFFAFTHDPATNLPTAQQALSVFHSALTSCASKRYAAIVFKPINFKQVNSLLGYHNSDLLLLQLAYCLQRKMTDNDKLLNFGFNPQPVRIARLQSLQFLVVYNLTDTRHDDKIMINELCHSLSETVPEAMSFKSFSLNFELAFGVAISGENGHTVDEITAHASDALLNGLNSQQVISYFDNNSLKHTQSQLARIESLRQDIEDGKLFCYLKPQINVKNHDIVGFQLRVHWYENETEHPLELAEFSSLAEQGGELYILTKHMLSEAFYTLDKLHRIGVYQRISVVLTSDILFEADLVDFIEQKLNKYKLLGKYLMIELSEAIMLSSSSRVKNIIDQLKSLEVKISITDFSGSYESLRYVRKVAIHQLKIDCHRLTNDSDNRVDKAITNSLVSLTRSMKIPLVGTNIDRHDASEAFIAMGGELIEGDIIHPGVVPDEIEIWLERWYIQHPESIPPEAKPSIY